MIKSNGYAFACGYVVNWYPTRGIAKHEHYLARRRFPGAVSGIEACSEQEAHNWASPFEARVWD